ncbi:hypothetical protein TNCV_2090981 [Trichonephila clavipes]|nr:hypothetical protein TNCV_2090981 [Trichonephila clavipes]
MHNATVQQPLTTMSPNLNTTIVMLQAEARFVKTQCRSIPFSISTVLRAISSANTCGFQSMINEATDALRTFHSTANNVEWYEWTPNDA